MMKTRASGFYALLRDIYTAKYMALNIAVAVAYYLLFVTLLKSQSYGIFILPVPAYLLYLLVITSSVLFTVAVYQARKAMVHRAGISAVVGTGTTVAGGIVGGCSCAAPLVFQLGAMGLSTSGTLALYNFVNVYQPYLFAAAIALNVALIAYSLNRLSAQYCRPRGRRG